jgi:Zn-dependent M28 family amino/carboxypeptidase
MMKRLSGLIWAVAAAILLTTACAPTAQHDPAVLAAADAIRADNLKENIRVLAADEMEGRGPGSPGEELATRFIADRFADAGLAPAGDDGTFFQNVPLVGVTADPNMDMTIWREGKPHRLNYGADFVAGTRRVERKVTARGELVWIGYGTQAPEYEWDDYKGFDPKGKILVMLINDPPLEDVSQFRGKEMTYYGRWTYKYDKARDMGALGVILVHDTIPASYGWEVVHNSWSGQQFLLRNPDKGAGEMPLESWVTHEAAERLFEMAGLDLAEQKQAAVNRDFEPMPMGIQAQVTIKNTLREVDSKNVLGILEGSDLKDQYVIYSSHWDHLGINPGHEGEDKIFNGAYDNATGTAALFELARAFQALPAPPRRSVIFLAVTAEEQGLLGSKYYAENPIYPLGRTVAAINMDGMNIWGRTKDIVVVGLGNSTLDDDLIAIAAGQDRIVVPDAEPEKGFYYRSDQFSFAKVGVPAIYADPGVTFIDKPDDWGKQQREKYTREDYHKPSDEFDPNWDLSGAEEDIQALFLLGYGVSQSDLIPEWSEGNEFRQVRQESLQAAGMK